MARDGKASYSSICTILPFVRRYAPIFHLHTKDRYRPSSIAEFLDHTRPQIEREENNFLTTKVTLDDLDRLKHLGTKGGADVYLTSFDDVTRQPQWLEGTTSMTPKGGTGKDVTGVTIVVNKGGGVVDVFYFCFFAFNWGGVVLEHQLGNHVGDWEHVMIRFVNGVPKYVWLSQHANGEAYKFKALKKYDSGNRPILYIAKGSHAIYAKTGYTDHTIPNVNLSTRFLLVDSCDEGALYDPLSTSYMYTYTLGTDSPKRDTDIVKIPGYFESVAPTDTLAGWLYFTGHWGDQEYPDDDPRQKGKGLLGFRRYGDGPTGPAFKDLMRKEVWPPGQFAAGQKIKSSLGGSSWTNVKDWFAKCFSRKDTRERVDVDGNTVP